MDCNNNCFYFVKYIHKTHHVCFLIRCKNAQPLEIYLPIAAQVKNGEKEEENRSKKDSLIQQKHDTPSVPASSSSLFTYTSVQGNLI